MFLRRFKLCSKVRKLRVIRSKFSNRRRKHSVQKVRRVFLKRYTFSVKLQSPWFVSYSRRYLLSFFTLFSFFPRFTLFPNFFFVKSFLYDCLVKYLAVLSFYRSKFFSIFRFEKRKPYFCKVASLIKNQFILCKISKFNFFNFLLLSKSSFIIHFTRFKFAASLFFPSLLTFLFTLSQHTLSAYG